MTPRTLRFVWGTPPVPAGRWHAGLLNLKRIPPARSAPDAATAPADPWQDYRRHRLHLSLRGLLLWSLALAACAYLAGAALILHRLERAGSHNRVTYLDLVLPTRWSTLERLRGESLLAQARERLAQGRFNEGFSLLRLGLARHPADHASRLVLAQIYVALRLGPQAAKLLHEGLARGYPGREYLLFAFTLAAEADAPARWVELVALARRRFDELPSAARPAADALWLDEQQVRALIAAGRPDEALALATAGYAETHPFRRELQIVRLLEEDHAAEALALADAWADQEPRAPEPLRLLARARRQLGEHAAMDASLARLRALDPASPEPLLYALAQQQLAGRAEAARATLETLLLRHGAAPGLYPALATVLGELGDLVGLARLEAELAGRGLSPRPVLQVRLQHAVATRDWPAALRHVDALRAAPGPVLDEKQTSWIEAVERLAHACLDASSGTQASLVEFVADRPGTLRLYALLLEALLETGRPGTARQILTLADGPYPISETLAALRPRVEEALAALPAPREPASETAAPAFASFEALAEAVAQQVRRGDPSGALRLLSAARRARPDWLPAAEARLDALELPLRARGEDPLRLQLLARATLAREAGAADSLLALARELAAESRELRGHASLLVKEILRHDPAHAAALDQLAVWEPRTARAALDAAR